MRLCLTMMLLFSVLGLTAVPLMVDLRIDTDDQVNISWQMVNPAEYMEIKLVCLQIEDMQQLTIGDDYISGDYGIVNPKDNYHVEIDVGFLPDAINSTNIIFFPKLIWDSKIYYEMELIPAGKCQLRAQEDTFGSVYSDSFYMSKFEATNEQYLSFINSDGYEILDFWWIDEGIMSNSEVGLA